MPAEEVFELYPTDEWKQLHDRNYRKQEVYSMMWSKMDISKFKVAVAPNGGPVAMIRDDSKIIKVQQPQTAKPAVTIYTSSGKLLTQIPWDKGKIVSMGWVDTEQLVCVVDDGTVRVYGLQGEYVFFSLGKEARDHGILDCRFWGQGLVALTGNQLFIAVTEFSEPRPAPLANPNLASPLHSWLLIEPTFAGNRHLEVLIATDDNLLIVDEASCQDVGLPQLLANGPIKSMATSLNGRYLALYSEKGTLQVVSTDFSKTLTEFDTESRVPPNQLVWCGNDCVALYWDEIQILLMIGPFGRHCHFDVPAPVFLLAELDGVRVISNTKCEFLQRVPNATEDIFKIGSTAAPALLYDAMEHFEKKSPKADDNLRSIKLELTDAVDACIEAASNEFSTHFQRTLLKAASFGKCFLENYNSKKFVDMCKALRVLNAVRHFEIGIPLTYTQYTSMPPEVLIDRLINRHQHLLALRVCEYLEMKPDRILVHWACAKVKRADLDDDVACRTIVEKLVNQPGISFAGIAETAYKQGRPQLATKLLDYEPKAADQVPLLMRMQEDEMALTKAIDSGDTDLVYDVLLYLKRKLPLPEFFRVINGKPVAANLLEVYAAQEDLELLKDFYYQDDRHEESANILVLEAYAQSDLRSRINRLKSALSRYNEDKDNSFGAKATEDQVKLLLAQEELQQQTKEKFVDLSLSQTITKCLMLRENNRAVKLRSDFKVSDKNFWWLKIKATAELGDWAELDNFSKSKKSPIGYGPFVEECIKRGNNMQAISYIARCQPETKPQLYMRVKAYQEAAEAAFALKDANLLQDIRGKCGNNAKVIASIDTMLMQLQKK